MGQLAKQFDVVNKMARQMAGMNAAAKVKAVKELGSSGMGAMLPGVQNLPGLRSKGSSHTASIKSKFKKRR